ncbi:hypothetical protein LguiB_016348 [Lonicera macranthoides]
MRVPRISYLLPQNVALVLDFLQSMEVFVHFNQEDDKEKKESSDFGVGSNREKGREGQSSSEKHNEDNKGNPKGVIVLGVYLHCQGCADEVVKSLRGFHGVEVIETDNSNNKVTVKGKKANPTKVAERLRKKTGKHVDLISPLPPKDMKTDKKKEGKKKEPKVVEVVLKVYLHCEGCAKDVKHCIHKMQGVHTVEPDTKKSHMTVKGVFEPEKLVEFVNKRAGKHAAIVKTSKMDGKDGGNNTNEGNNHPKPINRHNYPPEHVYAPQIFSDENPNACSLM